MPISGASSLESTLVTRSSPSGERPMQSVKVPPRSIQKRHRTAGLCHRVAPEQAARPVFLCPSAHGAVAPPRRRPPETPVEAPRTGLAKAPRMHRLLFVALLALAAVLPAPASACWDGSLVSTPHLFWQDDGEVWRPARAREVAKWAPRIEALLAPRDLRVDAHWGQVDLSDGTSLQIRHHRLERLFIELARHLGVSREERLRALAAPIGYSVQIAAVRDRARADALADRLNDLGRPDGPLGAAGMYDAGGFPAANPTVHVVSEEDANGRPVDRLVTGTFLTRAEADEVAREASAELGTTAFVRRL